MAITSPGAEAWCWPGPPFLPGWGLPDAGQLGCPRACCWLQTGAQKGSHAPRAAAASQNGRTAQ
eukprot:318463-Pelagomonas_calceolata.AAC.1